MKKLLCSGVAVLAIGLAGCGTSVSQVRQEALDRLDGMVYADQAKFRRELEVADSKEKVEALIEAAERDNQKTADKYWSCAAHAAEALDLVGYVPGRSGVDKCAVAVECRWHGFPSGVAPFCEHPQSNANAVCWRCVGD